MTLRAVDIVLTLKDPANGKPVSVKLSAVNASYSVPSIHQATLGLAELGGYTSKSPGGPPGTIRVHIQHVHKTTVGMGVALILPRGSALAAVGA